MGSRYDSRPQRYITKGAHQDRYFRVRGWALFSLASGTNTTAPGTTAVAQGSANKRKRPPQTIAASSLDQEFHSYQGAALDPGL
jgi:hypothetical protein